MGNIDDSYDFKNLMDDLEILMNEKLTPAEKERLTLRISELEKVSFNKVIELSNKNRKVFISND